MIQVKDDKCSDEGSQGSTGEKWGDSEFFFFFNLFIYFWLCWVFISVRGLSLVAASGDHSSLLLT